MSKQNYRRDEFQTITHLTASLPAREPLLGCSGGGKGQESEAKKQGTQPPTSAVLGQGERGRYDTLRSSHPLLFPALSPSLPEP